MLINACASRPSILRSQCTWLPRPIGTRSTRPSTTPPSVSPALRASSIAATIFSAPAASAHRTGDSSTAFQSISGGTSASTSPICTVWLRNSIPSSSSSRLHTAPTATRAAVSRALARSSTLRTSSKSYFTMPARSAWPGRRRVTFWISLSIGSIDICSVQFTQSRFWIDSAIGLPSVLPWRTPDMISARSCSIFWRRPRP